MLIILWQSFWLCPQIWGKYPITPHIPPTDSKIWLQFQVSRCGIQSLSKVGLGSSATFNFKERTAKEGAVGVTRGGRRGKEESEMSATEVKNINMQ